MTLKYLKLKANLAEIKSKVKKYTPHAQAIISIAATGLAAYYMREANRAKCELERLETVDENAWPSIEISPEAKKHFDNGATLKIRKFEETPYRTFIQFTTGDDFPDEANEDKI
jgi:hypothetical protein